MTNTEDLKLRRSEAVANGVATRGIYAARAQNAELWDTDGKRFIDFVAGIAVNNTGHRHPKVMEAMRGKRGCLRIPVFTSPHMRAILR